MIYELQEKIKYQSLKQMSELYSISIQQSSCIKQSKNKRKLFVEAIQLQKLINMLKSGRIKEDEGFPCTG